MKPPQSIFNALYKITVPCVLAISSASSNFSYLAILSASYILGINLTFKCLFNILARIPMWLIVGGRDKESSRGREAEGGEGMRERN